MVGKNPFDLSGQVAVITGSSKGIGRAAAETMAALGARVVVSSRKVDACAVVVDAIRNAGGEATAIACNISRKEEVQALVAGTLKHWGRIDTLVCNAAVNPYFGPLAQIPDEAFDKIMNSNVKSNLWLCKEALPAMAERGGGSAIILSSVGGWRGVTMLGAYGISKAADCQLARNPAVEWGPRNIRINCVAPGLVKTDFARALWEDEKRLKLRLEATPLRRIGEPDDIGGIIAFLASRAAAFITGTVIVADGGVTIV